MTSTVRSSLLYQLLLHVNKTYSTFLVIFLFTMFFYKGSVLPYQYHIRVQEFLIILLFIPIEAIRIAWGSRGNLTETPAFIAFSVVLGAAAILICVYLAVFQNYVLLLEMIAVCVEGGFLVIESILGLALAASLSKSAT